MGSLWSRWAFFEFLANLILRALIFIVTVATCVQIWFEREGRGERERGMERERERERERDRVRGIE